MFSTELGFIFTICCCCCHSWVSTRLQQRYLTAFVLSSVMSETRLRKLNVTAIQITTFKIYLMQRSQSALVTNRNRYVTSINPRKNIVKLNNLKSLTLCEYHKCFALTSINFKFSSFKFSL